MRKSCLLILLATILMVGIAFAAETPREGTPAEGKSTFTNVAVVGINENGVPGYIEFTCPDPTLGTPYRWYLYVTSSGQVYIASSTTLSTTNVEGKPPTSDWYSGTTPPGSLVGGQT